MISEFFINEKQLAIIEWLLNHSDNYYDVVSIAMDIRETNEIEITPKEMSDILYQLLLYDVISEKHSISYDDASYEIKLNSNSPIVKTMRQLDKEIDKYVLDFYVDNKMSKNYGTPSEHPLLNDILNPMNLSGKRYDPEVIENFLLNWRDNLKEPEDPIEKIMYHDIVNGLQELEQNGEFEDFIKFVKQSL